MQLGIRLHDIEEGSLEHRLEIAREQGFACGHLALAKVIEEYSVADAALTPGLAMYLKKLFAKYDIDIAVLGCYLNLADPDRDRLRQTQNRYLANIRFASLLGCGVVGTETGAPNAEYKFEEACHSDEAFGIFVKNFTPIVRYAEQMGVIIAIEPVCRHIVYSPKRARQLLDTINSPNLQIIMDPVNLLDMWNYKEQEEIVEEAIELLGDDVAVVHIKDFFIKDGQLMEAAAGTGQMDYTALMKFMKEKKPYIHATLECTSPDNAVASRMHMQKLWDQV